MRALFVNVPFVKHTSTGELRTGPNAGSRWPWTQPGVTDYACFPFFMAYAVRYLRLHGIEADFYDGVAMKHWDYRLVRAAIRKRRPEIVFFETSTPLYRTIRDLATWAKHELGARIVLTGPHLHSFAHELLEQPFVDHCIVGEYEHPALEIASDPVRARRLYTFDHLKDINVVNGENFTPYRPLDRLFEYWDPSMNTPRAQLQVSTSRGCPFKCTYCQWPKVMNDGTYRARDPELVIDEIRATVHTYREAHRGLKLRLQSLAREVAHFHRHALARQRALDDALARWHGEIRSILFDDDTWNLGKQRITELCRDLKDLGLPWTMMGRIDTASRDLYDLMVASGCVGMRFGIESFNQQLLDNTKKRLDARVSYDNVRYLLTRFSGMEFHFTTMSNLPGETSADLERDLGLLRELQELGHRSGNVVHWQSSNCVAFPGTELWDEMVARGKAEALRNFDLYDGQPENEAKLAAVVGWLGEDYRPGYSAHSKDGAPTDLPEA